MISKSIGRKNISAILRTAVKCVNSFSFWLALEEHINCFEKRWDRYRVLRLVYTSIINRADDFGLVLLSTSKHLIF